MTVEEIASAQGVSDETVRRWLRDGRLKGSRPSGGAWRVRRNDLERFELGRSGESRVLGDEQFLTSIALGSRPRRQKVSLDQLIEWVARTLDVPVSDLLSPSRRRQLSLARALITFHATRTRLATLAEVSRKLNRDPSTLCVAVERYRTTRPELFTELPAEHPDRDAESWRLLLRQV
ncbi:MAG: helix-turn-helix domain-containing protein [Gammaproteobacteria bacterium]|nr:helix-turn-helix domain-containing protein [Gammaproteobacteria bacterium]